MSGQSFAQYLEGAIACGVAEGIVDLLEVVHVQIQHHDAAIGSSRARNGLLQHVLELHAVRDFRQRVVAGEIADAPLGALAIGDVANDKDRALELRIVGRDWRARQRDRNRLAAARTR